MLIVDSFGAGRRQRRLDERKMDAPHVEALSKNILIGKVGASAASFSSRSEDAWKRRAKIVGVFPDEASITRLIGAGLLDQNDEWRTRNRHMTVEAFERIDAAEPDRILGVSTEAA